LRVREDECWQWFELGVKMSKSMTNEVSQGHVSDNILLAVQMETSSIK
jgi:hypothetical protein